MTTQQDTPARREPRVQTHLYPVGTVVEIYLDHNPSSPDNGQWTVTGLARNGVDSYVFRTSVMSEVGNFEKGFNLSFVTRIVKRGDGPVKIDQRWYGVSKDKFASQREMFFHVHNARRKGYLCTYSFDECIAMYANKYAPEGAMIDYQKISRALESQTWVRHECSPYMMGTVKFINKKRFSKWMKQNVNRFLLPMKTALAAEEAQQAEDLERFYQEEEEEFQRDLDSLRAQHGIDPLREPTEDGPLEVDNVEGCARDDAARADAREMLGIGKATKSDPVTGLLHEEDDHDLDSFF